MRGMKLPIFSLALMAALFSGCETSREVQNFDKPTAEMVGLRFQDVKLDYASLLFYVEVDNPYPTDLPLVKLKYSLTSEGNTFLTATAFNSVVVRPNRKEAVSLPDEVIYARLLKSLNSKPGSTIPYKAVLRLSVDAPNLGLIELSSEKEGWLVLPNAPEINVEGTIHRALDVIFIPTPQDVVDKMLELVEVKKDDLVYDLGCGDGRIPVTAAKRYGCKAVGYDLDPDRVRESMENVEKNEVGHLVGIEQKDIFTLDLSKADVITLYLLPSLNVRLIPQLEKLKPGSRIVSHNFDMEGVKPDKIVKLTSSKDHAEHKIYLWTTPLKREQGIPATFQNDSFDGYDQ
ncbi:MAG TPA: 50S ribosomal protein L11 methyltransferase [Sedimentisphaerales bacterium]|nr:50S ribosomal protein L11 methyltransferase [Sedimentisphaerales bacterium]